MTPDKLGSLVLSGKLRSGDTRQSEEFGDTRKTEEFGVTRKTEEFGDTRQTEEFGVKGAQERGLGFDVLAQLCPKRGVCCEGFFSHSQSTEVTLQVVQIQLSYRFRESQHQTFSTAFAVRNLP